jgi:hypothetical protein
MSWTATLDAMTHQYVDGAAGVHTLEGPCLHWIPRESL